MGHIITMLQLAQRVIQPVKHAIQQVVAAAPLAILLKTEQYQELLVYAQLDIMKYQIQVLVLQIILLVIIVV